MKTDAQMKSSEKNEGRENGKKRAWITLLSTFAIKGKWNNCCEGARSKGRHFSMFVCWWERSAGERRWAEAREVLMSIQGAVGWMLKQA